jgi:flagellar hook-basal body complex protein FliE
MTISPIDPTASVLTNGIQGNLIAGNAEALAGADQVLMHKGNGAKFVFELPKEAAAVNPPTELTMDPTQIFTASMQSGNFGHLAHQMVRDVNNYQSVAGEKVRDVLMGGKTTVHEAMVAVQESSVAFSLLSEMRNKMIDSYQELNRMSI